MVAGFVVLCGANIVGNIISAEKRCNYPGRSRVTRLVHYINESVFDVCIRVCVCPSGAIYVSPCGPIWMEIMFLESSWHRRFCRWQDIPGGLGVIGPLATVTVQSHCKQASPTYNHSSSVWPCLRWLWNWVTGAGAASSGSMVFIVRLFVSVEGW